MNMFRYTSAPILLLLNFPTAYSKHTLANKLVNFNMDITGILSKIANICDLNLNNWFSQQILISSQKYKYNRVLFETFVGFYVLAQNCGYSKHIFIYSIPFGNNDLKQNKLHIKVTQSAPNLLLIYL